MQTIRLNAGHRSDGSAVQEEVVVEQIRPGEFRLLRSPGLVLGLAADDVIRCSDDGMFELVSRGQNLCVQIFAGPHSIGALQKELMTKLTDLGGQLDGCTPQQLVFTVPIHTGFVALEAALSEVLGHFPEAEWYYGNVYGADGTTPLNWWQAPKTNLSKT